MGNLWKSEPMAVRGLSPSPRRPTSPRTTCGPPSPPARSCTGRARDRRRAARPRVFGRIVDVRSRASAPPLCLCIRFKRANSLPKVPMPAAHHLTCLGRATSSCHGAHQTSLPHSHRELPDHIDCGHTAADYKVAPSVTPPSALHAAPATTAEPNPSIGALGVGWTRRQGF